MHQKNMNSGAVFWHLLCEVRLSLGLEGITCLPLGLLLLLGWNAQHLGFSMRHRSLTAVTIRHFCHIFQLEHAPVSFYVLVFCAELLTRPFFSPWFYSCRYVWTFHCWVYCRRLMRNTRCSWWECGCEMQSSLKREHDRTFNYSLTHCQQQQQWSRSVDVDSEISNHLIVAASFSRDTVPATNH